MNYQMTAYFSHRFWNMHDTVQQCLNLNSCRFLILITLSQIHNEMATDEWIKLFVSALYKHTTLISQTEA